MELRWRELQHRLLVRRNLGIDQERSRSSKLKYEIDEGTARVISGPHKSITSKHNHITVHCKKCIVTYHLNVNFNGVYKLGKVDWENAGTKTGHRNDDRQAPVIANSDAPVFD